ncbi:ABC transporter substrate-binding protein [Actinoplanes sp. G11-F43]|uniref:ABC transporter substrate-binding protein n=1 Tax=Actinoplanes sp. G11-F43 TaxID=3424130 RepID=UPI003D34720C
MRVRGLAVLGIVVLLATGGCTRAEPVTAGGLDEVAAVTRDAALYERLPGTVRDRGFIRFVTDASYAPMEYFAADGRTIIGFEPDLAAALGNVLGIRVEMVMGDFATSLDEVNDGTYDGVLSAMTDTGQRRERADFVNYFNTGTSILVQRGNPRGIHTLLDLCGNSAAVKKGTYQEKMLLTLRKTCSDRGLTMHSVATNADALVELRTGRVTAALQDFPPASFVSTDERTSAFFQLASEEQYEPGLFGIAVDKGNTELRDCLRDALQRLIDSGVYADLLARWELTASAVPAATVNGT